MRSILLVDDEPELLEAWSFALQYGSYEVERARDGKEALRVLELRLPDLLITDLMMPRMNGEELSRAVRGNPLWAHIPILLHTSAPVASATGNGLWNAVLRKPARIEVFLATIQSLLQK